MQNKNRRIKSSGCTSGDAREPYTSEEPYAAAFSVHSVANPRMLRNMLSRPSFSFQDFYYYQMEKKSQIAYGLYCHGQKREGVIGQMSYLSAMIGCHRMSRMKQQKGKKSGEDVDMRSQYRGCISEAIILTLACT